MAKRSKFFYRRVIIVITLIMLLFIIIKGLTGLVKTLFGDGESESETSTATEESSPAIENTASEATSSETSPSETTPSETTPSESNSSETTGSTTETTAEVNMNFSTVSFYKSRLDTRYQAYAALNPNATAYEIVLKVNMNLDYAFYGMIESVIKPESLSALCNKYYALPSDFTPGNLVQVTDGYYVNDGKSYMLRTEAEEAFKQMANKAADDGVSLKIISAYRSNNYQANLYEKYKNNNGQEAADRFSARPGHSEHETGLAIDINDVSQAFENTDAFKWLQSHAHEFGFILRYPKGKEHLTGYMYEPWHYRYLGSDLATKVLNAGITYDEYYAMQLLE